MNPMTRLRTIVLAVLATLVLAATALPAAARSRRSDGQIISSQEPEKREFRGVWVQTAYQERYLRRSTLQNKAYLRALVETLHDAGFNAVLFQVRPEADAFYDSSSQPWSRFLTGALGRPPQEAWDPLAYMIDLCHSLDMELHAWVNPYRLSASKGRVPTDHPVYRRHPEWCVAYDGRWYLDPGMPEVRAYVRDAVKDIVARYDIDGIHFDDYFYPYPVADIEFDDYDVFRTYAPQLGIDITEPTARADFRRRSVDILIKYVHSDVRTLKPWVRFGISPFGIYRNEASWSHGSRTGGLQCYDDLYADVLRWANEGWIDYVIPQLYWEIGHAKADYSTLLRWWAEAVPTSCQLYIGQSIERSLDGDKDALPAPDLRTNRVHFMNKVNAARSLKNVDGQCFWYAYQVEDNAFGVRDLLQQNVFTHPAFVPAFTEMNSQRPEPVRDLRAEQTGLGLRIVWRPSPDLADWAVANGGITYCVYKFPKGARVSTDDVSHLLLRTTTPSFYDYDVSPAGTYTYVITVLDRYGNESKGTKRKVKMPKK